MPVIVTKPGGLVWEGVHYERGQKLPKEVRTHPSYPVLLSVNYIADIRVKKVKKREKGKRRRG